MTDKRSMEYQILNYEKQVRSDLREWDYNIWRMSTAKYLSNHAKIMSNITCCFCCDTKKYVINGLQQYARAFSRRNKTEFLEAFNNINLDPARTDENEMIYTEVLRYMANSYEHRKAEMETQCYK